MSNVNIQLTPFLIETLNSIGSGVVCVSPENFEILFINAAAEELLLNDPKKLEGQPFTNLFINEDKKRLLTFLNLEPLSRSPLLYDHHFSIKRSNRILKNISVGIKITPTDRLIIATLINNNPKIEVTEQLEKAYSQLIESSKFSALAKMSSGIAHQINNPIAIVHGLGDKLSLMSKKGILTNEEVQKIVITLKATSERVSTILKDLSLLSRNQSSEEQQNTQLKNIINKTLSFCQEKYIKSGIEILFDDISEDLNVYCHPGQIYYILLNLLDNAFYSLQKSPQESPEERKWIKLSIKETKDSTEVSIIDNGPGVPEEIKNNLMLPFFTTKEHEGIGLGLSITKSILANHRGSLRLDETSEHTCFTASIGHHKGSNE